MKTIGLISISDNADIEKLESGAFRSLIARFESQGYTIVEGSCVRKGIHETTTKERADQLNDLFKNPEIDVVWALDGGVCANEILPYLDYHLIKSNPKIFIGFSDITVIGNALYSQSGLLNYSGPTFGILRHDWIGQEIMLEQMDALLSGDLFAEKRQIMDIRKYVDYYEFEDDNPTGIVEDGGIQILQKGVASGTILGGNISTFNLLFGTAQAPDLTDTILFLEECAESSIGEIRRQLAHIRQQPGADRISGLVFGKINQKCHREYDLQWHQTILDIWSDLDIPIIADAGFGHIYPFQIFPIGGRCEIDTRYGKYCISL